MAREVGISEASVRRIWHAHGLKPHLIKTFMITRDPEFAGKLEAIVGLVSESAGACAGFVLRREEPDTSPGPNPARVAIEERTRPDYGA
jgi:hypothetical protein